MKIRRNFNLKDKFHQLHKSISTKNPTKSSKSPKTQTSPINTSENDTTQTQPKFDLDKWSNRLKLKSMFEWIKHPPSQKKLDDHQITTNDTPIIAETENKAEDITRPVTSISETKEFAPKTKQNIETAFANLEQDSLVSSSEKAFAKSYMQSPSDVLLLGHNRENNLHEFVLDYISEHCASDARSFQDKPPMDFLIDLIKHNKLDINLILSPARAGSTAIARTISQATSDVGLHEPLILSKSIEQCCLNIAYAYAKHRHLKQDSSTPVRLTLKEMIIMGQPNTKGSYQKLKNSTALLEQLQQLSSHTAVIYRNPDDMLISHFRIEGGQPQYFSIKKNLEEIKAELQELSDLIQAKPDIHILDSNDFLKGSPDTVQKALDRYTQDSRINVTDAQKSLADKNWNTDYILSYIDNWSISSLKFTGLNYKPSYKSSALPETVASVIDNHADLKKTYSDIQKLSDTVRMALEQQKSKDT